MAEKKEVFVANDGELFDTAEEAEHHENSLIIKANIEAYIKAAQLEGAAAAAVRAHVPAFNRYLQDGVAPAPKAKKPRKPKVVPGPGPVPVPDPA